VVRDLAPRTTPVSAAYLRWAARGIVAEPVDALLKALLAGGAVGNAARSVLCLGSWSGSDLLAGLLAGIDAALSNLRWLGVIAG